MTWYRVTHNDWLWCETSSREEAEEHFGYALTELPGERIEFQRLYEHPQPPPGHWMTEQVTVSTGENGLTRPTD